MNASMALVHIAKVKVASDSKLSRHARKRALTILTRVLTHLAWERTRNRNFRSSVPSSDLARLLPGRA